MGPVSERDRLAFPGFPHGPWRQGTCDMVAGDAVRQSAPRLRGQLPKWVLAFLMRWGYAWVPRANSVC